MRVFKKNSGMEPVLSVSLPPASNSQTYEAIYKNVKEYLVFKISITRGLDERMIYLDVLNYMERIQREVKKLKL